METRSAWADALATDFTMVVTELRETPRPSMQIFRELGSTKKEEKLSELHATGYLSEKDEEGEDAPDLAPKQGYDSTFTHTTWHGKVVVTEELMEDSQVPFFGSELPAGLALSAIETDENECMAVIDGGFADTGPDGVSLFNDSHPLEAQAGGTSDNLLTAGAISPSNLKAAYVVFRAMKDAHGIAQDQEPELLLVAPDDYLYAQELVKAVGIPDSANNNPNVFNGMLSVISSSKLTDTNAYFMFGPKARNSFIKFNRIAPSVSNWDTDANSGNLVIRVRYRASYGYKSWRGSAGSTGGA